MRQALRSVQSRDIYVPPLMQNLAKYSKQCTGPVYYEVF